jgi:thiol:disulfide interchange protein DsbD
MEASTFADPEVRQRMQDNFVLVQADVTDQFDPKVQPMKKQFGVFGPPAIIFFDADGNAIGKPHYGLHSADEFMSMMDDVLNR